MNKEFLLAMQDALTELLTEAETKSYVVDPEPGCDSCCQPDEPNESKPVVTPIDTLIARQLKIGVMTSDQASALYILHKIKSEFY